MKKQMIGILRDRGQLTIPEEFRNTSWLYPGSPLLLSWDGDEKLLIQPPKKSTDWKRIDELRAKLRSVKAVSPMSTVEFIRRDRRSH